MKPISNHALRGHLQTLRGIFEAVFQLSAGDTFRLKSYGIPGPGLAFELPDQIASTIVTETERAGKTACAVLVETKERRILCSFYETWMTVGRKKEVLHRFDKANMTFFLSVPHGETRMIKQIFRLEWENWQEQNRPNKAAYPHWQFDRWLTGSDAVKEKSLDELQKVFEAQPFVEAEIAPFETAEKAIAAAPQRPDLRWFTKLHFPSIAPWATDPIKEIDDADQSHRCIPDSVDQLEHWIRSALLYLKSELGNYA